MLSVLFSRARVECFEQKWPHDTKNAFRVVLIICFRSRLMVSANAKREPLKLSDIVTVIWQNVTRSLQIRKFSNEIVTHFRLNFQGHTDKQFFLDKSYYQSIVIVIPLGILANILVILIQNALMENYLIFFIIFRM